MRIDLRARVLMSDTGVLVKVCADVHLNPTLGEGGGARRVDSAAQLDAL